MATAVISSATSMSNNTEKLLLAAPGFGTSSSVSPQSGWTKPLGKTGLESESNWRAGICPEQPKWHPHPPSKFRFRGWLVYKLCGAA